MSYTYKYPCCALRSSPPPPPPQRPLTYSRALPEYAASSLPFAALWHLAFAVWTYSLFGMGRSILITEGFYQGLADTLQSFKVG